MSELPKISDDDFVRMERIHRGCSFAEIDDTCPGCRLLKQCRDENPEQTKRVDRILEVLS